MQIRQIYRDRGRQLSALLFAAFAGITGTAWAESDDAKQYIAVRQQYEQFRCEQVKLMRAQGDAANGGDMDKARAILEQRGKLMASLEVRDLEARMLELRDKLMQAHQQEDYDAILAAEGDMRKVCR